MIRSPRTIPPRRVRGVLMATCLLGVLAVAPSTPAGAAGTTTTGASTRAASPACGHGDLRLAGATNARRYGPATWVKLSAQITNVSLESCTIAVGPSWPSLRVTNAQGMQVWNSCTDNDRLGACPQFLALRTLGPGATYVARAAWDQGEGPRRTRVPVGPYHFVAALNGMTSSAETFLLAPSASRTVTVTQLDSGHSVSLRVGDRLVVRLGATSIYTWSATLSSNPAVLTRLSGTTGAATTTLFLAQRGGRAQVTATDSPTCYPQCLPPSRVFTLVVTVVP